MKVPKKIIDHEPTRSVFEFSAVTFKKSDPSRDVKKGCVGTVVDLYNHEKDGYMIETDNGETHLFHRHEFRLATPDDLARASQAWQRKQARKEPLPELPEMPDWMK